MYFSLLIRLRIPAHLRKNGNILWTNTHQKIVELLQFRDTGRASPHPGLDWLLDMGAGDLPTQKSEFANTEQYAGELLHT